MNDEDARLLFREILGEGLAVMKAFYVPIINVGYGNMKLIHFFMSLPDLIVHPILKYRMRKAGSYATVGNKKVGYGSMVRDGPGNAIIHKD